MNRKRKGQETKFRRKKKGQRDLLQKNNLARSIPLKAQLGQLLGPRLVPAPLPRLGLLGPLLDQRQVALLVARRGEVVLVEVNLAQEQHVFAADEEDAVKDVGVQALWWWGCIGATRFAAAAAVAVICIARLRGEYALRGGLQDNVCCNQTWKVVSNPDTRGEGGWRILYTELIPASEHTDEFPPIAQHNHELFYFTRRPVSTSKL